jgi:hypothetical protein
MDTEATHGTGGVVGAVSGATKGERHAEHAGGQ